MSDSTRSIWITWHRQPRNIGLAKALKVPLSEILTSHKNRLFRYFTASCKTVALLIQRRPEIVFAQNPSLVLGVLLITLKPFTGMTVILDAHNAGIQPLEGRSYLLNRLAIFLQRYADITIVTNNELANIVKKNGGCAAILPDKIPEPSQGKQRKLEGEINIFVVSSFAADEPYQAAISSAVLLPDNIHVYFSGNISKVPDSIVKRSPPNVHFTDFLPESEYWCYLRSSDIIMVLTKRHNCLVCGAYEALSLEKPMILSNTPALRGYFGKAGRYTENNASNIAETILSAVSELGAIKSEMKKNTAKIVHEWERLFTEFHHQIERLENNNFYGGEEHN